ncbi:hypothetical protein J6590_037198 [Homalodisca vitripennis]|nr:hypothetical protein J6590_037198 [Homalodisca vitripennis]
MTTLSHAAKHGDRTYCKCLECDSLLWFQPSEFVSLNQDRTDVTQWESSSSSAVTPPRCR